MIKRMVQLIVVLLMLCMFGNMAMAVEPTWLPQATKNVESTTKAAQTEVQTKGYIGGVENGGIDVDGDGTVDVRVDEAMLITVDVPLQVSLIAGTGEDEDKFLAPRVRVANTSGQNTIGVSLMGFEESESTGGGIVLTNKEAELSQHDLALKIIGLDDADNPFVSANGYVSNCKATPITMGNLGAGKAGWFTFGAKYTNEFNVAHAGQKIAQYKAIFRFDIE